MAIVILEPANGAYAGLMGTTRCHPDGRRDPGGRVATQPPRFFAHASKKLTAFTGLFGSYDSHRSCFPRSLAIPPNRPLGMTETMDSERITSVAYLRFLPSPSSRRDVSCLGMTVAVPFW